jgi:transposase
MWWGSFSGAHGKGPGLFWEKDWGKINAEAYQAKVVPLVCGWIRTHSGQVFMQDNAPAHKDRMTIQDLQERGITVVGWPPYSPDMNPIETLWCWMKDWIQDHYPEDYLKLNDVRAAVHEAWEAISQDQLDVLIESMPARIQAIIEANGMHTRF